ncbi:MAG: hypothetical protein IPH86_06590 [bacterium]|nr:hypothetical protein [bacterium]
MNLKMKILSGFGVVCVLLLASGSFSLLRVGTIRHAMTQSLGQGEELASSSRCRK